MCLHSIVSIVSPDSETYTPLHTAKCQAFVSENRLYIVFSDYCVLNSIPVIQQVYELTVIVNTH